MYTRIQCALGLIALITLMILTGHARASAVVELSPSIPGPFLPGQMIDIYVTLTDNSDAIAHPLRLIGFDSANSDLEHGPFQWDFSSTPTCQASPDECAILYVTLIDGPLDYAVYPGIDYGSYLDFMVSLPPAGAGGLDIGLFAITIPDVEPQELTLDVMNFDTPDDSTGARLDFGFGNGDPMTTWSAYNGLLAGGQHPIQVVPEPSALALLAAAAMILLRRKR